jgi:hypothetical protein
MVFQCCMFVDSWKRSLVLTAWAMQQVAEFKRPTPPICLKHAGRSKQWGKGMLPRLRR